MDDQYQCSCPVWIFHRKECKHIQAVKDGQYEDVLQFIKTYNLTFGMVREVTIEDDLNTVLVPLLPIGDTDFLATIVYDLLQLGVPWHSIVELEHLPKEWKIQAVKQHVQQKGRKIYGEWVEKQGFVGYQYISI
jgi:hypothetical protein